MRKVQVMKMNGSYLDLIKEYLVNQYTIDDYDSEEARENFIDQVESDFKGINESNKGKDVKMSKFSYSYSNKNGEINKESSNTVIYSDGTYDYEEVSSKGNDNNKIENE